MKAFDTYPSTVWQSVGLSRVEFDWLTHSPLEAVIRQAEFLKITFFVETIQIFLVYQKHLSH